MNIIKIIRIKIKDKNTIKNKKIYLFGFLYISYKLLYLK